MSLAKIYFLLWACLLLLLAASTAIPIAQASYPTDSTTDFTGSVSMPDSMKFEPTGSMSRSQIEPLATLLQDGKVLILGANNNNSHTAEVYDPETGIFSPTSNDPHIAPSSATLLPNGQVLVVGYGCQGLRYPEPPDSCHSDLYDPGTLTFTEIENPKQQVMYGQSTALLPNGDVLIVGGWADLGTNYTELYLSASQTFTYAGQLQSQRESPQMTHLPNGKIFVSGGNGGLTDEIYDPNTGSFSLTPSLGYLWVGETASLLPNEQVLLTGNQNNDQSVPSTEVYDTINNTWSATGNMIALRYGDTATSLPNGQVILTGGYVHSSTVVSSTEIYDYQTGTFLAAGNLTQPRAYHTATLLSNGNVLITGGTDANNVTLNTAELGIKIPENTFTGTLTLPAGWLNANSSNITINSDSAEAILDSASLSNNNTTWSDWLALSNNQPLETS